MNKRSFLAALLLMAAGLQTAWAQSVTFNKKTGEAETFRMLEVESITFSEDNIPEEDRYVDLELPSGTLWATRNIGANAPSEYGDFFAWGETEPKDDYSWNTYRHANSNGSSVFLTKYCNNYSLGYNNYWDAFTELLPEDDAATANWGDEWQMPSNEQWAELIDSQNTSTAWTTQDDREGLLVTSNRNGRSIFLPGAGYYNGTLHDAASASSGYHALYWSRSLYTQDCAQGCSFYGGKLGVDVWRAERFGGRTVRPVRNSAVPVTEIKLDKARLVLYLGRQGYESAQLTATILPENASNKNVTWESSDETVATVSETGTVKAVGVGYWGSASCTITCRATDGSNVFAECQVNVESTWGDDGWE